MKPIKTNNLEDLGAALALRSDIDKVAEIKAAIAGAGSTGVARRFCSLAEMCSPGPPKLFGACTPVKNGIDKVVILGPHLTPEEVDAFTEEFKRANEAQGVLIVHNGANPISPEIYTAADWGLADHSATLPIDGRPYPDHVSATFTPEIIPQHIRDKMKRNQEKRKGG